MLQKPKVNSDLVGHLDCINTGYRWSVKAVLMGTSEFNARGKSWKSCNALRASKGGVETEDAADTTKTGGQPPPPLPPLGSYVGVTFFLLVL